LTTVPTSKHILIAEDNDFNQELAVELLTEAGYLATVANNGQQLIDELLAKPNDTYHLILMDLEMPVLDGHQATIIIRKNRQFDHIPIIALTAHTSKTTKAQCAQEGMQDFLGKPFDPDNLNATLTKWLKQENAFPRHTKVAGNHLPYVDSVLPELKTINTIRGLQLSGNNLQLYLKLLKRFCDSQTITLTKIRNYTPSDLCSDECKRQLHTLKGLAATIAADNLADDIAHFEIVLENAKKVLLSNQDSNGYLQSIANKLDATIKELIIFFDTQIEISIAPDSTAEVNNSPSTCIETLLELLESASPDAVDFFQHHASELRNMNATEDFEILSKTIQDYEFELAIVLLKSMQSHQ
jgi:two-component system sensor histidine kinase/response regulator